MFGSQLRSYNVGLVEDAAAVAVCAFARVNPESSSYGAWWTAPVSRAFSPGRLPASVPAGISNASVRIYY